MDSQVQSRGSLWIIIDLSRPTIGVVKVTDVDIIDSIHGLCTYLLFISSQLEHLKMRFEQDELRVMEITRQREYSRGS